MKETLLKITRVKAAPPRELPSYGTGALHNDQQFCYEKGYREGLAALRKAQREYIERLEDDSNISVTEK